MHLRVVWLMSALVLSAGAASASQQAKPTPAQAKPAAEKTQQQTAPEKEEEARKRRAEALLKFADVQRLIDANDPKAADVLKEVIALDPAAAQPRIALGNLYFDGRNYVEAQKEALLSVKLEPDNADGHLLLGKLYYVDASATGLDKDKARQAIAEFEIVTQKDPSNIEAWGQMGELLAELDEKDKAIAAFRKVILLRPNFVPALESLASLLYDQNKYAEAADYARKLYELQPSARNAAMLADTLRRSGRTADAAQILSEQVDKNKGNVELQIRYAEALLSAGKNDEASKELQEILKGSPKNIRAVSLYAEAERRAGRREEAARILKNALEGQDVSDSLELVYRLAEVNEEMGHPQEALANYEEALSVMLNPDGSVTGDNQRNAGIVLRRIALVYRRAGDSAKEKQAIERMRKVLGLKDTLPDMVTLDGLQEEGKFQEAVQAARDAAKKFPDEKAFKYYEAQALGELGKPSDGVAILRPLLIGSKEDSRVYQFMAVVQMSGNDLDGAGKSIKEAIKLDKEDSDLQITLSSWQDRVKQYKESEETLRSVLKVDPNNATALNNLGYFLTERNERLDEALDLIKRAVVLEPSNGSFLDSLGWLYFKLGKVDDARKYIEQAIIYQPRSATIRHHLGDVYDKLGRTSDAIAQWKKALDLGHDPEEIAKIKEKLNSASAKN